jgi:hypothetical protein
MGQTESEAAGMQRSIQGGFAVLAVAKYQRVRRDAGQMTGEDETEKAPGGGESIPMPRLLKTVGAPPFVCG